MERPIIEIDEEKCDGCGQCVLDCAEGALAVVNGKARLIRDSYCDGLGACLNCPRGALRIVMREAEAFDEAAALAAKAARDGQARPQGCPGSRPRTFAAPGNIAAAPALTPLFSAADNDIPDSLRARTPSWPIQLRLLPPQAPFLSGAHVLLAAQCSGFVLPAADLLELDGRCLAGSFGGLEALALLKLEDAGKDDGREGLDGVVVAKHAVVVALTRVAHLVLGVLERGLELRKVGVRLKIGVSLGHGEELAQRTGQHVVRFHLGLGCGGTHGGVARVDHGGKRVLLVFGVALDGLDQVRDQVVAALQLRVDVLPGVINAIALGDHVVVDAGDGADNHNDNNDTDDDGNHGVSVSNGRGVFRRLPLV